MPRPRIERETTVCYNEEEDNALIWSASPVFQRKMERLGVEHCKSASRPEAGVEESRCYRVPKGWVKIRPARVLTDEQRTKLQLLAAQRFGRGKTNSTLSSEGKEANTKQYGDENDLIIDSELDDVGV